ncbi:MAG: hypothetical protein AYK19_00700 [Theionarchaea archaeon DG-70-1]|nr:MAG: hypothetical protein AYK19_00700 [Theionarchaea archaeon DG-70-1]
MPIFILQNIADMPSIGVATGLLCKTGKGFSSTKISPRFHISLNILSKPNQRNCYTCNRSEKNQIENPNPGNQPAFCRVQLKRFCYQSWNIFSVKSTQQHILY